MTDAIFTIDEDIDRNNDIDITKPLLHGVTIYSVSKCWKCNFIKDSIEDVCASSLVVNCDAYIKENREAFKDQMFCMMKTRPNDGKVRFPVVFIDGVYVSNYEVHLYEL